MNELPVTNHPLTIHNNKIIIFKNNLYENIIKDYVMVPHSLASMFIHNIDQKTQDAGAQRVTHKCLRLDMSQPSASHR